MADAKLTLEDRQRIIDWLGQRGAVRPCSVCGQTKWSIAEHLVTPIPIIELREQAMADARAATGIDNLRGLEAGN